jgi:hypothetical protein
MKSIARNQYFTLDILNKKIRGSERSFKLANKGCGDAYEQLMALMTAHPDYELEVAKAKSNDSKETYDGLSYQFMKDYIALQENAALLLKKLDLVIANAKKTRASAYPVVKRWFLRTFGTPIEAGKFHFDLEEAKQLIEEASDEKIFASAENIVDAIAS